MAAGSGFTTYDIERERLDALRDTSVDFYAALRSAYLMDRDARIELLLASDEYRGSDQGEAIFSSNEERRDSKPSRLNTDEYSDRRRASSLTVPFMKTSMTRQLPSAPRSR